MIKIQDFDRDHIEEAKSIALMNYREEKAAVSELPDITQLPDLGYFADNGLGVSMFKDGRMLGFLCCYNPWNNAFDSTATGTFSPVHAHGAVVKSRNNIYKRLYQAAAEKWVSRKISYHAVGIYAHDKPAIESFFVYGFGLRCIDAIRPLTNLADINCGAVLFYELEKSHVEKIREMRRMLSEHLNESPCFSSSSPEKFQKWLERAEARDSRLFAAEKEGKIISYMEVMDDGENFVTETDGMKNFCGAFCFPEYRGMGINQGLLDYIITKLRGEGYKLLGADFESFNPTANGFWLKYFTPYTYSLTRRIDDCALEVY